MSITLKLKPQRNAILQGFNNEFYALLEFKHKIEERAYHRKNH